MRVLDFFCGAGGFSEGFSHAGFNIIWAVDKWLPAVVTHQRNHPYSRTIMDDVERLSKLPDDEFDRQIPDAEIIIGSPPCVEFSNSNRSGKSEKDLGIRLIESYLRIVARKKWKKNSILKYWILVNVPNAEKFIRNDYSAEELKISGNQILHVKNVNCGVYDAEYFGVPSRRQRYFCGDFPKPMEVIFSSQNRLPLKKVLESLGDPTNKKIKFISDPNYSFLMEAKKVTDHHYLQLIPKYQWQKASRLKMDKGYMGKMSFPENLDKPARTVMATMTFGARESMILAHSENEFRAPTIREVATLMSFPIDYRFYGVSIYSKYRLIGNAVPPKLAFGFAQAIAILEDMDFQVEHSPRVFTEGDFVNLNYKVIPKTIEKRKPWNSKFTYHIPYLKINQYRVELTNHGSDFQTRIFRWHAEIHYSQGKKAKKIIPIPQKEWLPVMYYSIVEEYINKKRKQIVSLSQFQDNYCLTSDERFTKSILGPEELLGEVKNFLDSAVANDHKNVVILIDGEQFTLPLKIAIGYFILFSIFNKMEG